MMRKNGKNIFPEGIEALIAELDVVEEVLVSGKEDASGDIVITAEVYPNMDAVEAVLGKKPDQNSISVFLEKEVKKANGRLVSYKTVKSVIYRDIEFEKTTSRKIKRSYGK